MSPLLRSLEASMPHSELRELDINMHMHPTGLSRSVLQPSLSTTAQKVRLPCRVSLILPRISPLKGSVLYVDQHSASVKDSRLRSINNVCDSSSRYILYLHLALGCRPHRLKVAEP